VGLFQPLPRPDSFEDVFLARYEDLLRAALAITGGRREAEDLLHDAFVRVMLARPDLATIEHPDAYLRTVLRNLHAARLRRLPHRVETPLSIVEFDSAQFAARALTPSQWTQARHDVAAACRYACTRRLTSKTGSLFLLRFVHEIVPNDLARVTRLTRDTVDITLARGRTEVKAYLENPARALASIDGGLVQMPMPAVEAGGDDDHDYLAHVREAVFALRHEHCFEAGHLQRLYASTQRTAIPTEVLAEIVTCPHCLATVSRLTQVPPRADRPSDAEPPTSDTPSLRRLQPRDAGRTRRAAAEHACRAVRAHRPRLLRVLVNGFEIGTYEISGAGARVTQALSATEPVWLVEVYSEQDVCLGSLDIAPLPDAPTEQRVNVDLDDDRRLELALSFLKPWPTLHLVYDDPAYVAPLSSFAAGVQEDEETAPSIASTVPAGPAGPATSPTSGDRDAIGPATSPERSFKSWRDWVLSPWTRPRSPRFAWGAIGLAVATWLFFFTPGTPVSAAERLWRAITSLMPPESVPPPRPGAGPARQRDITLPEQAPPRARAGSPAPVPPFQLTPGLLPELEIDALAALHARNALVGQRIQVTRTPSTVVVEGLVEGRNRDELVRALRAVPHGETLRVALSTPEELIGTRSTTMGTAPSSSTLRAVTLERNAVPAADDLRRALTARGAGASGNIEVEIHRLANDGLRNARTAFLEAATLRALAERFDAARTSELSDVTSTKWRVLLAAQADRVTGAVDQVRTQLEPLFVRNGDLTASGARSGSMTGATPASTATPTATAVPATKPTQTPTAAAAEERLGDTTRRIASELEQVERATRAALAVAETAPATIELRDAAFWQRLASTRDRIAAFSQQVDPR
jgi:DNA-directed RNA polymerase specialized sigma24 family protein